MLEQDAYGLHHVDREECNRIHPDLMHSQQEPRLPDK